MNKNKICQPANAKSFLVPVSQNKVQWQSTRLNISHSDSEQVQGE